MEKDLTVTRGSLARRRLDRYLGIPLVWLLGLLRTKRSLRDPHNHIVLLQTAAIGDTLLMAASIRWLRQRFPGSKLTLVVGDDNAAAVGLLPRVDSVIRIQVMRPLKSIAALRGHRADVLIDYGTWPRINALIAAFSGAAYTIGFRTPNQGRHFAYDSVVDHSNSCHEIINQRSLLTPLGEIEFWSPSLDFPGLSLSTVNVEVPCIVFHPWASGSGKRLKEWPLANWVELAVWCDRKGFSLLITGGKQDIGDSESLLAAIRASAPGVRVASIAGKYSLVETARILTQVETVVSVNTGIMHMAALLGVPTVGLHGPTNPERWGPIGEKTTALVPQSGPSGYLNLGFEFPANADFCMERILVADVVKGLARLAEMNRCELP